MEPTKKGETDVEAKERNIDARRRAATQIDQAGRGLTVAMKALLTEQDTLPPIKVIGYLTTVQAYLADATCLLAQRLEEAAGMPQQDEQPKILVPGGKLLVPR